MKRWTLCFSDNKPTSKVFFDFESDILYFSNECQNMGLFACDQTKKKRILKDTIA